MAMVVSGYGAAIGYWAESRIISLSPRPPELDRLLASGMLAPLDTHLNRGKLDPVLSGSDESE
jgi:hypothetical protein